MIKIDKKTKNRLLFTFFFLAGIGLCIGGIWLTPLLAPGAAFIAGAIGMFQSVFATEKSDIDLTAAENEPNAHMEAPAEGINLVPPQVNIQLNNAPVLFYYGKEPVEQSHTVPRGTNTLTLA